METLFLTFDELPHDDDIDLRFYRTSNGFCYSPRRHWCLLAEIMSVETFMRLRLIVRDRDGTQFQIAVHTDDRGSEYPTNMLVPGHTVAILYAHQHGFLDFTTGIRQEEKQTLRVCARIDARRSIAADSNKRCRFSVPTWKLSCTLSARSKLNMIWTAYVMVVVLQQQPR